ncbi:MAG: acetamidase/formamidase family protein [Verrucomicrobia bacterium]|nr:acetamidase/formamidase family protein [Verrucomicrobiota bacterium]MBV8483729.1 acetamidase/formamidase family protein [Verrucomicrobiota bacterium]
MSEHYLNTKSTHDRWNRDLAPEIEIEPGDVVKFDCFDSSGGQVNANSTVDDFVKIDRSKIHTLTGPVAIKGAKAGDTLRVHVVNIQHKGWGWSSITPGLGFLPNRFSDPFLFIWQLEEDSTDSLAPAVVPLRPFCGVMGVAPAASGEMQTRPPGIFGGNMDVKDLAAGSTLYLPVFNEGALFSLGDVHAAQGDGEICINGIECPAVVTVRFTLLKNTRLSAPMLETTQRSRTTGGEWTIVESDENPLAAARRAVNRMIDFLVNNWEFSPEHAYLLCSVAMDLRIHQVVNAPLITVGATLSKSLLPLLKRPVISDQ